MLPSLLYTDKPTDKKISVSVFKDLQLLNFIPESSVKCVLKTCTIKTREARQKLFSRLLEDEKALSVFEELTVLSGNPALACKIFDSSRTENEKKLLFVNLMENFASFSEFSSQIDFGDPLTSSLSASFSKIVSSPVYGRFLIDLPKTIEARNSIRSFSLVICGDKVKLGETCATPLCRTVINNAGKLGIHISDDGDYSDTEKISPDIIEAIVRENDRNREVLDSFYEKYHTLYDESVRYYYDECEFYLSVITLIKKAKEIGVPFCFPDYSLSRQITAKDAYDVTLIAKGESSIVPNDVSFTDTEPFYYLTGANDGGKTTYLRTVGVLVILFLLGCPVPAEKAEIGGVECIYTHFPRDERFDGSGRFVEEESRVRKIIDNCDRTSLVLLNETYSATNEENAVKYTTELAHKLYGNGILGLYITHQHDISENEQIPFLQVVVDENDNNKRTFKVRKSRNHGGSFAGEILERYGLTPDALKRRFEPIIKKLNDNNLL
ncbi:MAG: hypothetical protein J6036_03045 [Clostridia bacterium]|nr:hypothetical protein [Clostridia bacterium]